MTVHNTETIRRRVEDMWNERLRRRVPGVDGLRTGGDSA